jgi:tetratricopeptide (TPR) repeat protein
MYEAEREWSQAEAIFREVLAAWRKRAGNDDLETVYAQRDLADVLEGQAKWPEAETLHREALVSWRKREGNGGSETSYTLRSLGVALTAERKWPQAEIVYREELALRRKQTGNDDPNTLYALRNLGITLEFEGKWGEAETAHQEALVSWRKRAGNDDPQTLYTLDRLGWTLEAQSKWSEAETAYREVSTARRKQAGNDTAKILWDCEQLCRVLRAQRKYHDMEQRLAEVLTPRFLQDPACSDVLAQRLDLMGRQGRWAEALADSTTLVQYQPTEYYWSYNVAALLARTHDRTAYEQLCPRISATFAETTNSYIAQRIADGCLLLPNSGAGSLLVGQLATRAVTVGNGDGGGIGYFQACKALYEYREGSFPEAVECAEKALKNVEVFARAKGCAVLAMAQWRLGQKDPARATLSQGDKLAPDISYDQAVDLGDGWLDWLVARILLNEATELIADKSTPSNDSKINTE